MEFFEKAQGFANSNKCVWSAEKKCPENKPELNVCHNKKLDQNPSMVLIFNLTSHLRAV